MFVGNNNDLLDKLRKLAIISFFYDDDLLDTFVLKGGNALNIAYEVNERASMDIDFSMKQDFGMDIEEVLKKITDGLQRNFSEENFVPFDIKIYPTPGKVREEYESFWGGYTLEFKVISQDIYSKLQGNLENIRKQAISISANQGKSMKIDISKYEYVEPKSAVSIDGYTVYVYTPIMVVYEKFRALCQQNRFYSENIVATNRKSRARDFFDIHSTIKSFSDINYLSEENLPILIEMFKVKRVPLFLLQKLNEDRELHRLNFQAVIDAVNSNKQKDLESFDYYFDYVLGISEEIIQRLVDLELYDMEEVQREL